MHSHNYLFLSDLHLSEGRDPETGILSRLEDFFHDDAFGRMLAHYIRPGLDPEAPAHQKRPWKLIINGDVFDFLQVTRLPAEGDELERVRGVRSYAELTENEREYGLGTRSAEVAWKLEQIAQGHPVFFQALGWFMAHPGHELIILRGNHDVETCWPAVQERLRQLLASAYATWRQAWAEGLLASSPLFVHERLLPALSPQELQRVRFPPWFYYEPGLFYVEHGNQYDPANAFSDIISPFLPDRPEMIELPSGSFFVRYFFNKVEEEHPFADNIKPISRYIRWAINEQPVAALSMLVRQRKMLPRSIRNLLQKKANPIKGVPGLKRAAGIGKHGPQEELPLSAERWQQISAIREEMQARAGAGSTQTTLALAGVVGLNTGYLGASLLALRALVKGAWRRCLGSLAAAAGLWVGKTILGQKLSEFDSLVTLADVAEQVCLALNMPDSSAQTAAVPFHLFGHDHRARIREIHDRSQNAPPFRQWYVNTGAWLPVFNERDRLTRSDIQLTYFCLMPGQPGFNEQAPPLLEWLPEASRPRPVRLLE